MNSINTKSNIYLDYRRELLICIFIVIAVFASYWQLPKNDFISFDDDIYVTKNLHVQRGFTGKNLIWAFTTFDAFNWHPLTWLSYMMDCQLFGLNASMHHLMSLFFHIINSVLLLMVLRAMTDDLWPSAFVALLFAVHPLHVESVAWVSERKDLLSTFFCLLTISYYFRYAKKQSTMNYIFVILFYMLGLMAKPMLVTLPFVLLLLDFWPIQRMSIKRFTENSGNNIKKVSTYYLLLEKLPLFILSAISSFVTLIAQKEGGMVRTLQEFPIQIRFSNAVISYIRYIGKMVFPTKLSFYYPYPKDFPVWKVFGALLLMICITVFAIKKVRDRPFFLVGWFWYVGTLIPVIGIVQVATQSMADRYMYIPIIGLFIIVAWSGKVISNTYHYWLKPITVISIFIIIGLMLLTWQQAHHWQNDIALYSHDVEVTIDNPLSNYHLGLALEKEGKIEKAMQCYTEAIRIKPDFTRARNSLGNILVKAGRYEDALIHYRYAVKLKKDNAEDHFNLGFALMKLGKMDDAIKQYKTAIKIDENYADAHYNLGIILSQQKKYEFAVKHFTEVVRINPKDAEAYNNLGNVFVRLGKVKEAVTYYKKAIEADPDCKVAKKNLDSVLNQMKDH